ncbi:hypothetical protein [Jatrophihabitans fulvus]
MTTDTEHDLRAGRRRVARSRGALSGILLLVLGAWAALIPFIGPYLNLATNPSPNDAWNWTSGRGLFQLLPGAVAALAGLILLLSASRMMTVTFSWIAAAAGAWIVIAPSIAPVLNVSLGGPDPSLGEKGRAAVELLQYWAIGGAILFVAGTALGRLSVHSVRDVKAAERRAETEAAAERQRVEDERRAATAAAAAEEERRRQHADRETTRDRDGDGVPDDHERGRDRVTAAEQGHAGTHDHGHRDHGRHEDERGRHGNVPAEPVQGQPYQQPVQGQPVQGQPVQGQPVQQPVQGQPVQGQPVQQPVQGQPYQPPVDPRR